MIRQAVRNRGRRGARKTHLRVLLSRDLRPSRTDVRLGSDARVVRLRARMRTVVAIAARLPSATPLGRYRIIGCVDPRRRVRERREGNNCAASPRFRLRARAQLPAAQPGPQPETGAAPPREPWTGGVVEVPGVGSISFPAGAFASDTSVVMSTSSDPHVRDLFDTSGAFFRATNRQGHELRVSTGSAQPLVPARLTLPVPDAFRAAVPPGSEIRIFARNVWSEEEEVLETLELMPERFDRAAREVTVTIPPHLFGRDPATNDPHELVVVLATTPTGPGGSQRSNYFAAKIAGECEGSTLDPPLTGDLRVTSPFGPRTHPVTGEVQKQHYGVDYAAAEGTPVLAVADGQLERAASSSTAGDYIYLRHEDGSASAYMHLQPGSELAEGMTVTRGTQIALSGRSGRVSGPHLHFEYAPNGKIQRNDQKIDPVPCIGRTVTGDITVGDNGNLADDAFTVAINGLVVCRTATGATNTCAVGNLRPGTVTLILTADVAPDDLGTYFVSLSNGLTFADGGVEESGSMPQGASVAFEVNVPE
jgi:hypothetical protein